MQNPQNTMISRDTGTLVSTFMGKVYGWMMLALVISGLVAYYVAHSPALYTRLFGSSGMVIGLIVVWFGLVIVLSAAINKLSAPAASLMFIVYSVVTGVVLSSIFIVYTKSSIASVFFICAAMFGVMSVIGIFIKRDLSGVGSFMFIGLIGIIIASIVNIFLKSPMLYWVISYIGVFVFLGLTAADTQKLKQTAHALEGADGGVVLKYSIIGALTLYLDFINLFLFLLRIFGDRR